MQVYLVCMWVKDHPPPPNQPLFACWLQDLQSHPHTTILDSGWHCIYTKQNLLENLVYEPPRPPTIFDPLIQMQAYLVCMWFKDHPPHPPNQPLFACWLQIYSHTPTQPSLILVGTVFIPNKIYLKIWFKSPQPATVCMLVAGSTVRPPHNHH